LETLASSLEDSIDENLFLSSSLDMIKKQNLTVAAESGRNGRTRRRKHNTCGLFGRCSKR
jgi:hypothetical protein